MLENKNDNNVILTNYFAKDYIGIGIDVGSGDGITNNYTHYLEQKNWEVICVEANHTLFGECARNRNKVYNYAVSDYCKDFDLFTIYRLNDKNEMYISSLAPNAAALAKHSGNISSNIKAYVHTKTLNDIIQEAQLQKVDIISISTEGTELNVLQGLDFNIWKPKLFVISQKYNDNCEIEKLLQSHGYKKDFTNNYDIFYVLNT